MFDDNVRNTRVLIHSIIKILMNKTILLTGIFLGITAIVFGAFAAHGLKKLISVELIQSFETGVRYQMYHALFLMFLSVLNDISVKRKKVIFYLILVGLFMFSGSIYVLATNSITDFNFKTIGFITPIGGLVLISAWLLLFVYVLRNRAK